MAQKDWTAAWKNGDGVAVAKATNPNKELAKEEAKKKLDAYLAECRNAGAPASQRDFQLNVFKEK